ncbi:hypothetical protein [Asticcacaulis sp.]|uniref:hypothetical protein n=1 Tax=Asticcacaulis sp. TaxID=1872648 RepID=UPI003F7B575F
MWSRRHFSDAKPAGVALLKSLFGNHKTPVRVIDNLAAVALPLRRLARAKAPNPAH